MENHYKIAALYVASLKGIAIIHQYSHWITKGISFYGDHLLFERVYNSAIENADEAAEKFIGVFGEECLDYSLQNELLNKVLLKYNKFSGSPLAMSLAIEKDFLKLSKDAYDIFKESDKLSLGLDDMIMSIANAREGAVYLLQQAQAKI